MRHWLINNWRISAMDEAFNGRPGFIKKRTGLSLWFRIVQIQIGWFIGKPLGKP